LNIYLSHTKYFIVENNIADICSCIWWYIPTTITSLIDFSNIINNSQQTSSHGLIGYDNHNLNINQCSIINNRANNQGKLLLDILEMDIFLLLIVILI
jgi:hypothetical protein